MVLIILLVDAEFNSDFVSLPAVMPLALNNGTTDAIILWIYNKNCSSIFQLIN